MKIRNGILITTEPIESTSIIGGTVSGSIANATSASYAATASLLLGSVISSSYSLSASYAPGLETSIDTSSFVTTSSFNAFTASYSTGSLFGTSSWANNAQTASYISNAVTINQAILDFGATEEYTTFLNIADTAITATSKIVVSIAAESTVENTIDDILVSGIIFIAGNCINGVGFTIYGYSASGATGTFKVNYIIYY